MKKQTVIQLDGHENVRVNDAACAEVDGLPLAVTGASTDIYGGGICVWDLRNGRLHRSLGRPDRHINAIACTVIDGLPVAIAGGASSDLFRPAGLMQVWDLRHGRKLATLRGHRQQLRALDCIDIDGAPIVVSGSGNVDWRGELMAWDLRSRRRLHTIFSGKRLWVSAVVCAYVRGAPIAVVGLESYIGGGKVQVWDLRTWETTTCYCCALRCRGTDGHTRKRDSRGNWTGNRDLQLFRKARITVVRKLRSLQRPHRGRPTPAHRHE